MKKRFKTIASAILSALILCAALSASAFTDTNGHWAETVIDEMTSGGYLSGYPDGSFRPDAQMTKAEFASSIVRVFDLPLYYDTESLFRDVPSDAWYAPYAASAELLSMSSGDGIFEGEKPVTRLEAAYTICSIFDIDFKYSLSVLGMSDYLSYASDSEVCAVISAALDNGIMYGTDHGFEPYKALTRAELCAVLWRSVNNIGISRSAETKSLLENIISGLYYEAPSDDYSGYEPDTEYNSDNYAAEVLDLVNEYRAEEGLKPLKWDDALAGVARMHSEDMAARGFFDHENPDGESPFDRMEKAGISYRAAGENIAAGQRTPEEVMEAWMNSPGHKANILSEDYGRLGVGIAYGGEYGVYWTQCFTN